MLISHFRLQFIFVATHHTNLFQYFEVTISDKDLPRIIIADMTEPSNMRKYVFPHSLVELATSDSLEGIHNSQSESSTPLQQLQAFFDSYLEGSLLPTLRSDAPDTAQKTAPVSVRDAVNILHGSTFQAMYVCMKYYTMQYYTVCICKL